MNRIVILLTVFLTLILTFNVSAQVVEVGSVAQIPEWDQMKVVNSQVLKNDSDLSFSTQDPCVVHRTGKLTVKKKDEHKLLVEYSIEGKNYLGSCPSGVLFSVTEEKFRALNKRYYETRNRLDILW